MYQSLDVRRTSTSNSGGFWSKCTVVDVLGQRPDELIVCSDRGRDPKTGVPIAGVPKIDYSFHLGKCMPNTAVDKLYPKFSDWNKLRQQYDPDGIFVTEYWRDHLNLPKSHTGPVDIVDGSATTSISMAPANAPLASSGGGASEEKGGDEERVSLLKSTATVDDGDIEASVQ